VGEADPSVGTIGVDILVTPPSPVLDGDAVVSAAEETLGSPCSHCKSVHLDLHDAVFNCPPGSPLSPMSSVDDLPPPLQSCSESGEEFTPRPHYKRVQRDPFEYSARKRPSAGTFDYRESAMDVESDEEEFEEVDFDELGSIDDLEELEDEKKRHSETRTYTAFVEQRFPLDTVLA
jgi:hypothetical protein